MARPKLRPEERSDEQLPNIRVTVAERERVEEKAAAAGMTVTQYIRRAVLKTRIAPKRGSTDQALLVELNRVGTNLTAHSTPTAAERLCAMADAPERSAQNAQGGTPSEIAENRDCFRYLDGHYRAVEGAESPS